MAADNKNNKDRDAKEFDPRELFAAHPSAPTSDTDTQQTHDTQDSQHKQDHTEANLVGPPDSDCSFKSTATATRKSSPSLNDYTSIRELAASPLHLYMKLDWIFKEHYPWEHSDFPKTPMWDLAHNARALPEMREMKPKQAWLVVDQWCQVRERLWEEDFGTRSDDHAEAEFMDLWKRIERPAGEDSLTDAVELATVAPITLCEEHQGSKLYHKVMSVAFHLQKARRGTLIFLPCHSVARLLGCSHDTVARCLRQGVEDGLLKLVNPAEEDRSKAAEYRFAVERFDENGVEIPAEGKGDSSSKDSQSPITK